MAKKNYAYINHKMLIWARTQTPFNSTEEVERRFPKVDAKMLDIWESGEELPSVTEAKRLANIYKLPFAAFYLSEEPQKKVKRYTDRRTFKGHYTEEISYNLWSEIQRIEANRESILTLLDEDADVKTIPVADGNCIVDIANTIREYLELTTPLSSKTAYGSNPFNYYRNIIERNDIMVAQVSGVDIEEMKGISIYNAYFPIVAINNKDYDRAKVFSLFHELAHIFRRSSSLCTIDIDEHSDEEEAICDRIAAETLMPEASFTQVAAECIKKFSHINSTCIERIAGRFGVSTIAALRRMLETNLITGKEFWDLFKTINDEYNANVKYIEEQRKGKNVPIHYYVKYLNQNGYLLPRYFFNAHASGKISHGELCRTLGINTKHVGSIEQAVMFK